MQHELLMNIISNLTKIDCKFIIKFTFSNFKIRNDFKLIMIWQLMVFSDHQKIENSRILF